MQIDDDNPALLPLHLPVHLLRAEPVAVAVADQVPEQPGLTTLRVGGVKFQWVAMCLPSAFKRNASTCAQARNTDPSASGSRLTYLRLADMRVGLLINFGEATIKAGITRLVNGLEE